MVDGGATKVLVTGANGQVGFELARANWPAGFTVDFKTRVELDITEARAVEIAAGTGDYDILVNAAAYTAVDRAENEPQEAQAINCHGVDNLARAAARIDAALIHISTDYVFDGGLDRPYTEGDPVAPLGIYGKSKEAGERAVRNNLARHLILRTAWVYGAHGENFVKTMLRLAGERECLAVVGDQVGTPTAAAFIATAIIDLAAQTAAERDIAWGTYHLSNSGEASWYDFAIEIFEECARQGLPSPKVERITTAEYPTLAARPKNSRLDCSALASTFKILPPHWRESLKPVMDEICATMKGQ